MGAGPNIKRSDVTSTSWWKNLLTLSHMPWHGDDIAKPPKVQGVYIILRCLGNSKFRIWFLIAKHLDYSTIISNKFLDFQVRAICFMEGFVEWILGTVCVLGSNNGTLDAN